MQLEIIFLLLCESICSNIRTSEALIGKKVKEARKKEFSFVVSIGESDDRYFPDINHFCTGTLITTWHILTAAHCFDDRDVNETDIFIGSVDLRKGKKYTPRSVITYNEWAKGKEDLAQPDLAVNDIAIITLMESTESLKIDIPDLIPKDHGDLSGTDGKMAGWGIANNGRTARKLNKATVKILSNFESEEKLKQITGTPYSLHERFMCSAADPYILVQCGDSGGPLLDESKKVLIAVNMGTCPNLLKIPANYPNLLNLHARIDYYRDFIDSVIEDSTNCSVNI